MILSPSGHFLFLLPLLAGLISPSALAQQPGEHAKEDPLSADDTSARPLERIIIEGKKPEKKIEQRMERPGQSVRSRPERHIDFSQIQSQTLTQGHQRVESSQPSFSGFSAPRVRGQDTRLSEVYVEDILLQDPWSGLSITHGVNLLGFGEVSQHTGLAPWNLPSLNPISTVQFRFRPILKNRTSLGLRVDSLAAGGVWGRGERIFWPDGDDDTFFETRWIPERHSLRVYVSGFSAPGDFPFFDNRGTPENFQDDGFRALQGNDHQSAEALALWRGEWTEDREVATWARIFQSESGVVLPWQDGVAEDSVLAIIGGFQLSFPLGNWTAQPHLDFRVDETDLQDPSMNLLNFAQQRGLQLTNRGVRFSLERQEPTFGLLGHLSHDTTEITQTLDSQKRTAQHSRTRAYLGATRKASTAVKIWDWSTEGKVGGDLLTQETLDEMQQNPHIHAGAAFALHWRDPFSDSHSGRLWTQFALFDRPASLLEKYGNGSTIQANSSLQSEVTRHLELGLARTAHAEPHADETLTHTAFQGSLTLFRDHTENKIQFVPTSVNGIKALNLGEVILQGAELWTRSEASAGASGGALEIGVSWLSSQSSDFAADSQLTWTPSWIGFAQIHGHIRNTRMILANTYRGALNRDLGGSIRVQPVWRHDLSVSHEWHPTHEFLLGGLSISTLELICDVQNLSNLQIVDTQIRGRSRHGREAYSEIDGLPLPGRHYRVSAVVHFEPKEL